MSEKYTFADSQNGLKLYGNITIEGMAYLHTMGIGNIGRHIASISPDGTTHLHTLSAFDGELTIGDAKVMYAHTFTERKVLQADDTGTYTGTNWESQFYAATSVLSKKRYFKTGPTAPTAPVTMRIYKGTSVNGPLVLDQIYQASDFPADTEIELPLDGYFETEAGSMYFTTITCDTPFSIKTNSGGTAPWVAADDTDIRAESILQTKPWVSGESWDDGDLYIGSRQIYVCNTTGAQTGTFEGNSDKWDFMGTTGSHSHTEEDPVFMAWDKETGIVISESQISDLQEYLTEETDPIFDAWDKSTGISITESQISDLTHTPEFDGDIAEIFNSAGDLKIQPNGDATFFKGSDVGDGNNGHMLYIYRKASEGDRWMRMYITASQTGMFHANADMTFQGQVAFTIRSVTGNMVLQVGEGKQIRFRDSDANTVATLNDNGNFNSIGDISCDGNITADGNITIGNNLTVGGYMVVDDDVMVYGDISTRIADIRSAIVFQDGSTQEEAGERHFAHGHTHTAVYTDHWYDSDAESISERDLHFSPDGLMMYIIGLADNGVGDCCIWEYELTVPWDLSTVGTPTIESIESYGSNQIGLFISQNGRRLWTVCTSNDTVIEYSMNPWNISALSWIQAKDISGQATSPSAVFWSARGNRLFIADDNDNDIVAFSVAGEWDISGISWFENFGTDIDAPTGLHFSSDGRRMYVMDGSAEDDIHEFHLSIPWRIATARLVNLYDVSAQNASPQGLFLRPDNSEIYMVGTSNPEGVYGYSLGLEVSGAIISNNGPIRVGSMTTTQRDALVAVDGDIIYNTTTAFIEFYQDGGWINMEDSK